jgi:hypothetical protein
MAELQRPVSSKRLDDNNNDVNFDRKLDIITAGAKPFVKEHLLNRISKKNCQIIIDYILAMQTEVSPRDEYRINVILKLKHFAEVNESKTFREITRQDIIDFWIIIESPRLSTPCINGWVLMKSIAWL